MYMKIELKSGEVIEKAWLGLVMADTSNVMSVLDNVINFMNTHNNIEKYGIELSFARNNEATIITTIKAENIKQLYDMDGNKLLN